MDTNSAVFLQKRADPHGHTAPRVPCRTDSRVGLRIVCVLARRARAGFRVPGLEARA